VLALAAAGAITAFVAMEPKCLGGPFGKIDPMVGPFVLDDVKEARSLAGLYRTAPALAVTLGLTLAGLIAIQSWSVWRNRTVEAAIRSVVLLVLAVLAVRYFKMSPYAHLFGIYCAACAIPRFRGFGPVLSPRITALLAVAALSPLATTGLVAMSLPTAPPAAEPASSKRCQAERDFVAMAALPPSRVLAQADLGGFLALYSRHRMLTGNYHRLDRELVRSRDVLHAPVTEAHAELLRWSIDIVVLCRGGKFFSVPAPEGSLAKALEDDGAAIPYLQPLPAGADTDVRAYLVRR
jgi:hypothetical protein